MTEDPFADVRQTAIKNSEREINDRSVGEHDHPDAEDVSKPLPADEPTTETTEEK